MPAQVVVPRLVGLDSATAQSILDTLGLRYRITARPDPSARPGTVLETDPPEGSVVREGTPITVVVAAAAPSPSPPSPVLPSPAPALAHPLPVTAMWSTRQLLCAACFWQRPTSYRQAR